MFTVEINWKNTGFKFSNTRLTTETFSDAIKYMKDTISEIGFQTDLIEIFENDKLIVSFRAIK